MAVNPSYFSRHIHNANRRTLARDPTAARPNVLIEGHGGMLKHMRSSRDAHMPRASCLRMAMTAVIGFGRHGCRSASACSIDEWKPLRRRGADSMMHFRQTGIVGEER